MDRVRRGRPPGPRRTTRWYVARARPRRPGRRGCTPATRRRTGRARTARRPRRSGTARPPRGCPNWPEPVREQRTRQCLARPGARRGPGSPAGRTPTPGRDPAPRPTTRSRTRGRWCGCRRAAGSGRRCRTRCDACGGAEGVLDAGGGDPVAERGAATTATPSVSYDVQRGRRGVRWCARGRRLGWRRRRRAPRQQHHERRDRRRRAPHGLHCSHARTAQVWAPPW